MSQVELVYQILCDDVRLEIGNKLSFIGVFQEIYVQQLPIVLPKLAVLTQWCGEGEHSCTIQIISPDRTNVIGSSPESKFRIPSQGYANSIAFFLNIQFLQSGKYILQTSLNRKVQSERTIIVGLISQMPPQN
ncbi:MAG: hypothetical protein AB1489_14030 [Acidobacteriota bacterium]